MTKRVRKLSKEQREAAHSPPESNAGLGWHDLDSGTDPIVFEEGEPIEDYDPWKEALK